MTKVASAGRSRLWSRPGEIKQTRTETIAGGRERRMDCDISRKQSIKLCSTRLPPTIVLSWTILEPNSASSFRYTDQTR